MKEVDITRLDVRDLETWEWASCERAAESVARGDTPEDARDLVRMAEGFLCLLQAVRDGAADSRSLEMNIEGRTTEDERVGQFSIEGQPLSVRLLVPVTQSIYDDLVFLAQRTEGATREAAEDVGAALVAASLLLRDCAVLHKPPKTPPAA
jgi:hypothetical protein